MYQRFQFLALYYRKHESIEQVAVVIVIMITSSFSSWHNSHLMLKVLLVNKVWNSPHGISNAFMYKYCDSFLNVYNCLS
jgi:hypothetical protein